jgi:4a-hydroxytetrahydrobiopterin dehydratase
MKELAGKHCKPCEGGVDPLSPDEARELLRRVSGWSLDEQATELSRTFQFRDYYGTMAFVNAVAWVAHQEDHHPDLRVSYDRCRVSFHTHAIGGLSENDFICAAKVETLIFDE